ncbi:MAG: hypothetical protein LCH91_27070 [Bacteroidetes bacterium]|nr:hypothetical protein [Bacteroidota bacterium]
MKDPISIRITFSESVEKDALAIIDFLEERIQGLNFQKPRTGNNPKYKEGGKNFDPEQGEFKLAYSRLNIKAGKAIIPKIRK